MRMLPMTFTPGPFDVICAMGKNAKAHEGNTRYRTFVQNECVEYGSATSKLQKTRIVSKIISLVRGHGGAFVKFTDGQWHDVGDAVAREKVGQSLREKNHGMYRSSTKAKQKMRKELNEKLGDRVSMVMSRNRTVAVEINNLQSTIEEYQREEQKEDVAAAASVFRESDLELAMTNANSRILASLKTDDFVHQIMSKSSGEDDSYGEPTSE